MKKDEGIISLRYGYKSTNKAAFQSHFETGKNYQHLAKPKRRRQILLESRCNTGTGIQKKKIPQQ